MPYYTYKCTDCNLTNEYNLSISKFIEKKDKLTCKGCDSENILRNLGPINSLVEKSVDEIIMNINDDVKKTVKKVKSGDLKTIQSVYGNE